VRHRAMVRGALMLAAGALLSISGCGSLGKPDLERSVTTGTDRTVGVGSAVSKELRVAIRRSPTSPERVVLRLWQRMQQGPVAQAVSFYDPRSINRLGRGAIERGLAAERTLFASSAPHIAGPWRAGSAQLLLVTGSRVGAPPLRSSFLLRRQSAGWRVQFDSMLEDGLRVSANGADARPTSRVGGGKAALIDGKTLAHQYVRQAVGSGG
jgi:hypothetical protein